MITDFENERSTFSHVSMLFIEAMKVRLLMITLMPFLSEFSLSTANVPEPFTLCLISRGSVDVKFSVLLPITHESVFDLPVAQTQVTVSPGYADCLSQITEVASTINILS